MCDVNKQRGLIIYTINLLCSQFPELYIPESIQYPLDKKTVLSIYGNILKRGIYIKREKDIYIVNDLVYLQYYLSISIYFLINMNLYEIYLGL